MFLFFVLIIFELGSWLLVYGGIVVGLFIFLYEKIFSLYYGNLVFRNISDLFVIIKNF